MIAMTLMSPARVARFDLFSTLVSSQNELRDGTGVVIVGYIGVCATPLQQQTKYHMGGLEMIHDN